MKYLRYWWNAFAWLFREYSPSFLFNRFIRNTFRRHT